MLFALFGWRISRLDLERTHVDGTTTAGFGGDRGADRHRRRDDRPGGSRLLRQGPPGRGPGAGLRRADHRLGAAPRAHVRVLVLSRPHDRHLSRPADGEAPAAAGRWPPFRSLAAALSRDRSGGVPGRCGRALHRARRAHRPEPGDGYRREPGGPAHEGRALAAPRQRSRLACRCAGLARRQLGAAACPAARHASQRGLRSVSDYGYSAAGGGPPMATLHDYGSLLLGSSLRKVSEALYAGVDEVYRGAGVELPSRCFPILFLLRDHGRLGISELAAKLGQTHPAVSQMSRKLLRHRVITESPDPKDDRRRLLSLSPHGRSVMARLEPVWKAIVAAAADLEADHPLSRHLTAVDHALEARGFAAR